MPQSAAPPALYFRRRLGSVGRFYYGFMAAATAIIFLLVTFILLLGWSDIDGSFLWLFLAGAVGAPLAAWFFGKAAITGLDLITITPPQGDIARLIWSAALGDAEGSASLQSVRNRLRGEVALGSAMDEPRCRGAYSVILEQIDRALKAVSPENVVPIGGSFEDKQRFLTRLEAEQVNWSADYIWFEKVVDSLVP